MRTAYPPSTQAIKLTVRPATAKYADPATAGTPSSIAIVGTSAEGSAGRENSRFKIVEPSRSKQMTPIPNKAWATASGGTWPRGQPPRAIATAKNTVTSPRPAAKAALASVADKIIAVRMEDEMNGDRI